jgi:dTDP-4-dehydrorhamnose 3,5-epimerase-like enzyme
MKSVKFIEFPIFREDNGVLSVFEYGHQFVPFSIKRIFNVKSEKGSIRGKHAHRLCSQLLICSNGSIEVLCDDSVNQNVFMLDKPNYGLLVPPGIWAEEKYIEDNSTMTVICDRIYEAKDYISDYQLFKDFASKLNDKVKN